MSVPCIQMNYSIDRKKLLTCLLLTGERVGGVVMRVDELGNKDMNMSFFIVIALLFFYMHRESALNSQGFLLVPRCILNLGILSSELKIPLLCFWFLS